MTPAHKQTNPDKAPGQIVNPVGLTVRTLGDYLKKKEHVATAFDTWVNAPLTPAFTLKRSELWSESEVTAAEFGWNAALEMIDQFIETIYPADILDNRDVGYCESLDIVTGHLNKEKK